MGVVSIIYKRGKNLAAQLGLEMKQWFEQRGVRVHLQENVDQHARQDIPAEDLMRIPPESIAVVVLGGDGTLLPVARAATPLEIPILGINFGSLGFITELKKEDIARAKQKDGDISAASLYQLLLEKWLVFEYERAHPRGSQITLTR